ncbi:KUP/HAK/KT family potassium transporter, partial [Citrobacter youngae]|uniref:KUP/HAK/KT family potassium transporter n=1 Tax=Citrobacter youngae TaxID=133448 RepID=UPI0019531546
VCVSSIGLAMGSVAHAYGLAVTGTMTVTTCMAFIVMRKLWKWSMPMALLFLVPFLALDILE